MNPNAVARARKIRLILFDVDGVLTDGVIWVVPSAAPPQLTADQARRKEAEGGFAIFSDRMAEAKGFSAHDGIGISLARLAGLRCGIITRRISDAVALRARDLHMDYVYLGQQFKMQAVRDIMAKGGFSLDEIAYLGDDVIDLPVMRVCGLAVSVANARSQAIEAAHYVTAHEGGYGAARDAIEFILEAKGVLNEAIEKYLDETRPSSDTGTAKNEGDARAARNAEASGPGTRRA